LIQRGPHDERAGGEGVAAEPPTRSRVAAAKRGHAHTANAAGRGGGSVPAPAPAAAVARRRAREAPVREAAKAAKRVAETRRVSLGRKVADKRAWRRSGRGRRGAPPAPPPPTVPSPPPPPLPPLPPLLPRSPPRPPPPVADTRIGRPQRRARGPTPRRRRPRLRPCPPRQTRSRGVPLWRGRAAGIRAGRARRACTVW